ncbi:hypothetical protein LCGC14_2853880 [marine sediment metagenome]|uniref:UDP-glucose/GDP-mannose dehydrogenase dimerisation domain-containing protein n=1 Tax=marine sediment metagenome TaxID=412755 RepID=A0A0F8Y7L5_9ZZZZ
MKVAIVGMGYVGKGMLNIFPDAVQFDEPLGIGTKDEVNECDLAIVCVPTPSREDGSCDTSIIEEVVSWLKTPLILFKSAVEPGTTDRLKKKYKKRICVSPEYSGEGNYWTPPKYPDPKNTLTHGFMILGGDDKDCEDIADIFVPKVGPATRIRFVSAKEAEVIKYAENSWGATKVIFANELRDICEALGVSWHKVREGWVDDPRVELMHTAVFKDKRGFGGKCFPKDTFALLKIAEKHGVYPKILKAMIEANKEYNG